MKEILGQLHQVLDNKADNAKCTYNGDPYEVWEVTDELFEYLCGFEEDVWNDRFPGSWLRQSEGSVIKNWETYIFNINGQFMHGLLNEHRILDDGWFQDTYSSLTEYLCEHVGYSQPRNVCAVAMDLAKMNGMSMGKLFEVYEG